LQPKVSATEPPKHFVVLLHGLMRTRHSMKPIESKLVEEGYTDLVRFSYASTRSSISDHAAALREVLEDLPQNAEFSFVGHSMGNIVVRYMIGDLQREGDPSGLLARCRSMVMLGPPNQGAAIARRLAPSGVYGLVTGKGGIELGPKWEDFVQHLATPPFPFAIIAGDLSENRIQNPLVDGSGDFIVSVEETRLEGSESFETVPVLHSFLMSDQPTISRTVEFIRSH
jgi:pimeloyl-ACP methyl ester carboxylesterase